METVHILLGHPVLMKNVLFTSGHPDGWLQSIKHVQINNNMHIST